MDVSTRFVMPRLAGLAKLLAMDNDEQRHQLINYLKVQSDEMQKSIMEIARQKHEDYWRLLDKKRKEMEDLVKKYGGPTEMEVKAVESAYRFRPENVSRVEG